MTPITNTAESRRNYRSIDQKIDHKLSIFRFSFDWGETYRTGVLDDADHDYVGVSSGLSIDRSEIDWQIIDFCHFLSKMQQKLVYGGFDGADHGYDDVSPELSIYRLEIDQ